MAEIIKMPKLSDTMTEGVVAKWHKKIGDFVKAGDLIAEIETDKATMEFESFQTGQLLYIGIDAGKSAAVNSILAILGKEGEDVKALLEQAAQPASAPKQEEKTAPTIATPTPMIAQTESSNERIKISPLAKKVAVEKGLSINDLVGTGDQGRIILRDVENAHMPVGFKSEGVPFSDLSLSSMRKTIAKRLTESKQNAPHYYLMLDIDMDLLAAERQKINTSQGLKISFNDFVVKAVAMALKAHPEVNSSFLGDKIRTHHQVNIGVAVAVEEGLLVPVIRDADQKSLSAISQEVKNFATKAKEKKLQPKDWEGSTFTISNLGMMGIESFTSIINSPDGAILSVGAILKKPVVKNDQIVVGQIMKVTLACDHRVIDGAQGAAFLQTFKNYLEQPLLMLV